jgi:hypothetical protein
MHQSVMTIDVFGLTCERGNSPVHGLTQLSDHHHRVYLTDPDGLEKRLEG